MTRVRLFQRVRTLDSLRYRDFRLIWILILSISSGISFHSVVYSWYIYDLTDSSLLTSFAVGASVIPYLFASPLGGVLSDIWDRRKLIIATSLYQIVLFVSFSILLLSGKASTWIVFTYILAVGIGWAMCEPARYSLLASVVPRENIVNAYALAKLAFGLTGMIMPALAGLLIELVGPGPTLWAAAGTYVIGLIAVFAVRHKQPDLPKRQSVSPFRQLIEGASYVKGHPMILALVLIVAIGSFISVPTVSGLLPVYAAEIYNVGPTGLGLLMSAMGIGMTIGTFAIASIGNLRYRGRATLLGISLIVVMMAAFAACRIFPLAIVVLIGFGIATMTYETVGQATMQSLSPENLRGRVTAFGTLAYTMAPLGGLIFGGIAEAAGAQMAVLMGAAATAGFVVILIIRFRGLWSLR